VRLPAYGEYPHRFRKQSEMIPATCYMMQSYSCYCRGVSSRWPATGRHLWPVRKSPLVSATIQCRLHWLHGGTRPRAYCSDIPTSYSTYPGEPRKYRWENCDGSGTRELPLLDKTEPVVLPGGQPIASAHLELLRYEVAWNYCLSARALHGLVSDMAVD
jgi:hypothetical protein